MRTKNGTFVGSTSRSNVLHWMIGTNCPSHATDHCLNLLISPSTATAVKCGRRTRSPIATSAQTRRKNGSVGADAIRSVILQAMAEKSKHLLGMFHPFSRPQSQSTF